MKIYRGKKVFVTGVTGFKGSWLAMILLNLGANVKGYSLEPEYKENHYDILELSKYMESELNDVRDYSKLKKSIQEFRPDLIINMAAQPLVRLSYKEPFETFNINILGTLNLLDICRNSNITKSIINVITDKCYEDKNQIWAYREKDSLGGDDPYSASKACAEIITRSYRKSFFNEENDILLASVLAGNTIGGGDFSEDRLIPDIMKAYKDNSIVILRNPYQIRPWQHVLDVLYGYLLLGKKLLEKDRKFADTWNFGPFEESFITVEELLRKMQNNCNIRYDIQKKDNLKETEVLKLDSTKARTLLKWKPKFNIDNVIDETFKWYKNYFEYEAGTLMTKFQIKSYFNL